MVGGSTEARRFSLPLGGVVESCRELDSGTEDLRFLG